MDWAGVDWAGTDCDGALPLGAAPCGAPDGGEAAGGEEAGAGLPAGTQRGDADLRCRRLRPHASAEARSIDGVAPGVHTLLVEHHGNATASVEEAAAITADIEELIGAVWHSEKGSRPLTPADVLVVAPYNTQVLTLQAHLQAAGLAEVLVGTVDKLQGRQAPVVYVSMTASSGDEVPRGMAFLLNRNRLNVAISRAQYRTVVVRSPALTDYLPTTPDGMVDLGAFLAVSAG